MIGRQKSFVNTLMFYCDFISEFQPLKWLLPMMHLNPVSLFLHSCSNKVTLYVGRMLALYAEGRDSIPRSGLTVGLSRDSSPRSGFTVGITRDSSPRSGLTVGLTRDSSPGCSAKLICCYQPRTCEPNT